VIVGGALLDRAKNRRAADEILAPPQRTIPQFHPDSPAPAYLSELQARRIPDASTRPDPSPADREQVTAQLKDPATVTIQAGLLSKDFITDRTAGRAVLDHPRVLLCAERVESLREVLTLLEQVSLSRTPLVIAAPSMSEEVRSTLEVNAIRQLLQVLVVSPVTAADLETMARATGAQVRSRSDLQAGYAWLEHLGSCGRWVSTAKSSHIINPRPDGTNQTGERS
ncbi:MAG: hypothetical protein ABWX96_15200, partial [Propionibacteriaceae bacterium]